MYHDVAPATAHAESGFDWPDAALYKLDVAQFSAHLQALNDTLGERPHLVHELSAPDATRQPWLITFDDGGVSAYTEIAGRLEALGWRGHFFVTTGYIGQHGFLQPAQIRELHARGHVIGSHSHTHPLRMAQCSRAQMQTEWRTSVTRLSDLLGEAVTVASVPGGLYARPVAETAAEAGIRTLFTSEPTARCHTINGCLVFGRYSVQRWTPPQNAAEMARGARLPRWRQAALWNLKKAVKRAGGTLYLRVRQTLADRLNSTQ